MATIKNRDFILNRNPKDILKYLDMSHGGECAGRRCGGICAGCNSDFEYDEWIEAPAWDFENEKELEV
jgi:hypothetical protein